MWISQFRKNYSPKIQKTLENAYSFPREAGVIVRNAPTTVIRYSFPREAGVIALTQLISSTVSAFPREAGVIVTPTILALSQCSFPREAGGVSCTVSEEPNHAAPPQSEVGLLLFSIVSKESFKV